MGANPALITLSKNAKALELAQAVPHRFPGQRRSPWIPCEGVLWREPSQSDLLFMTTPPHDEQL
jgi:hypothetical protein